MIRYERLTEREAEILRLICEPGQRLHSDVARELGIKLLTLKHHLHNVYAKLRCRDTAALGVLAIQLGYYRPAWVANRGRLPPWWATGRTPSPPSDERSSANG